MIRKILLTASGNGFDMVAMRHAIDLAQRHRAVISLVQVKPAGFVDPWDQLIGKVKGVYSEEELSDELKRQRLVSDAIGRLIDVAVISGVRIERMPPTCDLVEVIRNEASSHDLIVIGMRGLLESNVVDDCHAIFAEINKSRLPLILSPDYYKPIDKLIVTMDGASLSPDAWEKFDRLQLGPFEQVTITPFIDSVADADALGDQELASQELQSRLAEYDLECHAGILRRDLLQYFDESDADLVVLANMESWLSEVDFVQMVREAERMLLMLPRSWTQSRHDVSNMLVESLAS